MTSLLYIYHLFRSHMIQYSGTIYNIANTKRGKEKNEVLLAKYKISYIQEHNEHTYYGTKLCFQSSTQYTIICQYMTANYITMLRSVYRLRSALTGQHMNPQQTPVSRTCGRAMGLLLWVTYGNKLPHYIGIWQWYKALICVQCHRQYFSLVLPSQGPGVFPTIEGARGQT